MTVRETIAQIRADKFLIFWNVSIVATLVVPLFIFFLSRARHEDMNDRENYNQYGQYVGRVHWWQFWRNPTRQDVNYNYNYNQQMREETSPWWWIFDDDRAEENEGTGTLVFVYVWTVIMLIGLSILGNKLMLRGNPSALKYTLVGYANYSFICCVLVGGLAVEANPAEYEEHGWYGQPAVLVFLTCLFSLFQCVLFASWMHCSKGKVEEFENNDFAYEQHQEVSHKQHQQTVLQHQAKKMVPLDPEASVESQKAPVIYQEAPVVSQKAPVIYQAAPVVSQQAPVVSQRAPVLNLDASPLNSHF